MAAPLRELYPEIEPFQSGHLQVSELHSIYYEQVGRQDEIGAPADATGKPPVQVALVVHGGPGGGISPFYRQFFDPTRYRVVLFDQRGAGQSLPYAELRENTTWDLVEDIEKLRKHLNIERWVVFGGSWGSTLALAYAQTHPSRVKALVLRGIFTLRRPELLWFYQDGASWIFPDAWEKYLAAIPEVERGDMISAYYHILTGQDEAAKIAAAKAWTVWEMSTSRLYYDPDYVARGEEDTFAVAFARIESHYFVHGGFFRKESQLIEDAHLIADIPGVIVQGRYDLVCPMKSAWDLHKKWPKAELKVIPDAGHSAKEPGIISALVEACDQYASLE